MLRFLSFLFVISSIVKCNNISSVHPYDLYNEAISYHTEKNMGSAMINLKKAYLLMPYELKIQNLLFHLRKELGLPSSLYRESQHARFFALIFYRLSSHLTGILGAVFLVLTSLYLSLILIQNNVSKYIHYLGVFFAAHALFFMLLSINYSYKIFYAQEAIVIKNANMYEEASAESRIIDTIKEGLEVHVIEEDKDFYLIKSITGEEAWIYKENTSKLFS